MIGEIQLLPGTYDYSFQCTLPSDLPSSFLGYCGHVKYTAQVVLNISRWPDKTFKQKFILLKPTDLNGLPSLRVIDMMYIKENNLYKTQHLFFVVIYQSPVTRQKELTVELRRGYNRYLAGPINISARLPDGAGYVPGQSINVEFDVDNKDMKHAIVSFNVRLFRVSINLNEL